MCSVFPVLFIVFSLSAVRCLRLSLDRQQGKGVDCLSVLIRRLACLFVNKSDQLPIYLYIYSAIHQLTYISILSVHLFGLFTNLHTYLYVCLCLHVSIYLCLSMYSFICLFICLSFYLYIYLSIYLSTCLSICLNLVSTPVYLFYLHNYYYYIIA